MFDLEVDGEIFGLTLKVIRESQQFDWKTKDKKHNAYDVKSYGGELNQVN